MKRVGYDADQGRYYFRDKDGQLYQGPEGSEYGELTLVADAPIAIAPEGEDNDIEAAPRRADGYQSLASDEYGNRSHYRNPYRTLFPFFLVIAVVLLLVWRLVLLPTHKPPPPCPERTLPYRIQSGDTCWDIVNQHNSSLEKLKNANPKTNCDKLIPGERLCVPEETLARRRRNIKS